MTNKLDVRGIIIVTYTHYVCMFERKQLGYTMIVCVCVFVCARVPICTFFLLERAMVIMKKLIMFHTLREYDGIFA
jgi:hypothetical protein